MEKTKLVMDVFRRVAGQYDLMNDLMSLGIHRLWKAELIKTMAPQASEVILDMAGGTGDITLGIMKCFQKPSQHPQITVGDINPSMIEQGRRRALNMGYAQNPKWMVVDATHLPFEDESFDKYVIAFGLRNVTDIPAALKEARRVLKPGGQFFCLEFSKLTHPALQKAYELYTLKWLPKLGAVVAKDAAAYQYLAESIAQFYTQEELVEGMHDAGFQNVRYQNLSAGIVAIHQGQR
jgi:demethylmenaquinone methyltransferase/2-methoxy-6-polyprenyl-1,4-benzoquinol methylase